MRKQFITILMSALFPLFCAAQFGDTTIEKDTDEEANPQLQCEKWAKQDGVVGTADYDLYIEDCLNRFAVPNEDITSPAEVPEIPPPTGTVQNGSKPN